MLWRKFYERRSINADNMNNIVAINEEFYTMHKACNQLWKF